MKYTYKSLLATLSLLLVLLASPLQSIAAEPADMAAKVANFYGIDPALPSGVPNQKGVIGSIISTLFSSGTLGTYPAGTILPDFLKNISYGVTAGNIPKWNGSQFTNSLVSDNGSRVNINGQAQINGANYFYLNSNILQGDTGSAINKFSNDSNISQITVRDLEGSLYGSLYGDSNGSQFGLLDGDENWSYLANKDNYTQLLINNVAKFYLDNTNLYLGIQQQQIGWNLTGDRYAYTDYVGDDTYTDYGLRIMRGNTGPNTFSILEHRGTGDFVMNAFDAAPLKFRTNSLDRMTILPTTGNVGIGTSSPGNAKLYVSQTGDNPAIIGNVSGNNYGVAGLSSVNTGVYGRSYGNAAGVFGYSDGSYYGVEGRPGNPSYGGVLGYTQDTQKYGILGYANTYSFYGSGIIYNNGRIQTNGQVWANQLCNAAGASCVSLPLAASTIDGGGSAGMVARFTDADTLGTGVLRDNGTNVSIGGAISGTHKLEVYGGDAIAHFRSSGSNAYIRLSINSDINQRLELANRGGRTALWNPNTSDAFNIEHATGEVGIGTTDPLRRLDVVGDAKIRGNVYTDNNYGNGLVGLYSDVRYQGVFAMGDSYKLLADGTGPGALYGIAWTHANIGGQSKTGLGHQALFMTNGVTQSAIGSGIWTLGNLTAPFMYDQNDAGYYVDPNGTSNMWYISRQRGFGAVEYDVNDTSYYVDPNATSRFRKLVTSRQGMKGTYDSTQTQGIWSIGDGYDINEGSNSFGNQYGITYSYEGIATASAKRAGMSHAIYFVANGGITSGVSLDTGRAIFDSAVKTACVGNCF